MKLSKIIFFAFVLTSTIQVQLFAQTKNELKEQKELAKSIIDDFLTDSVDEEFVYLLKENFPLTDSINEINSKRKTKIKLVDKFVLGSETYCFQSIVVKGNTGKIIFGNSWRSLSGVGFHEIIVLYKCQKKKGKWNCQAKEITTSES